MTADRARLLAHRELLRLAHRDRQLRHLELVADHVEIEDLRERFLTGFAFPALRAGAIYEGKYPLGTALARPLLAAGQVACAQRHGADALAHGCTGKGNDQVRFELTYQALAPDKTVLATIEETGRLTHTETRTLLACFLFRENEVFKRVRVNVIQLTQAKQTPWEMSSLSKDIVFVTR